MVMIRRIILIFAFVLIFFAGNVNAQIFINEFQASNTGNIVDPDYNESADWI